MPSARFVVAFSSRAKKCRRKIRSLSSRRLAVDFFPSRRPSTRRASFGVFCCSLFIFRRNRKGTTTSCSARQSASRDRNETNRKTRKRTLTIFVPKQNARRLVLTLAWHQSPRVHLAPRTQCDDDDVIFFVNSYSLFLFCETKSAFFFLLSLDDFEEEKKENYFALLLKKRLID